MAYGSFVDWSWATRKGKSFIMNVTFTFPACNRLGGIERVTLECANYFASCGDDVSVVSEVWPEDPNELSQTVNRIQLRHLPSSNVGRLLRFQKLVRSVAPCETTFLGFGVQVIDGGIPWAQSVHKSWLEYSKSSRNRIGRLRQTLNPLHFVVLSLERRLYSGRNYRHLVALTQQVKCDLTHFYGCPGSEVSVIPNGYSPTEFNVVKAKSAGVALRNKLGIKPNVKVISFVANEIERKGLPLLLRAMAEKEVKDMQLIAAGRFPLDVATKIANDAGVLGRCHFLGSQHELAGVYGASNVFVLPTQYEAWGLVIVEALACGIPVVVSDIAGAAVAINNGKNGQLCNRIPTPSELCICITSVLSNTDANQDLISSSVVDYQWDTVLSRYRDVVQQVVAR